jgi:hypothetical protein
MCFYAGIKVSGQSGRNSTIGQINRGDKSTICLLPNPYSSEHDKNSEIVALLLSK